MKEQTIYQIENNKNRFWFKASLVFTLFIIICIVGFVKIGSAVGTYPAVDPNMVLYYHFNNQSSVGENATYVYDWSNAHANNGTTFGDPVYNQTGGFLGDGAFNFNGTNYIRTPSNLSRNPFS